MKRRRAFTLVELLVVIAIISVLISILLPVGRMIRHRALVLACPIAYVGEDWYVHLTDPQGNYDLRLEEARSVWGSNLAWSPSGQRIGFTCHDRSMPGNNQSCPAVLNPMNGRVKPRGPGHGFAVFVSWVDNERFLEAADTPHDLNLWHAETGEVLRKISANSWIDSLSGGLSGPLPPTCAPGAFVAVLSTDGLTLLRKDLSVGRKIPAPSNAYSPRIDPLGEWIAWSGANGDKPWSIGIRPLNAPASTPTTVVKMESRAWVCDWTEDGRILVNVQQGDGKWSLCLFDKTGQLIRKIATAIRPTDGPVAAYRKYGHR